MAVKKPVYQLRFGLDLAETDDDGVISPEEARIREETARQQFEIDVNNRPEWYQDYLNLIAGGWPFRIAMYIAWASSPKKGRKPENLSGLASLMGLNSPRQIHKWREKNDAIDERVTMLQAAPLFQHRADMFRALVESASDPSYRNAPDRRLFAQLVGDLGDETTVQVRVGVTGDDVAAALKKTAAYEETMFGDLGENANPTGRGVEHTAADPMGTPGPDEHGKAGADERAE